MSGHRKWSEITRGVNRNTWRHRANQRYLRLLTLVYRVFPWLPDPW